MQRPSVPHVIAATRLANRNIAVILLRETLYAQMSPDEQRAMRERAMLRSRDYD